ncbi:GNAT family N-acetyltransferase [Actinoplanes sp. NEAU-A12]|uniref:GNAT family N-acetyltransferase n=1 Tax=Actinoplanes sandaracinus TaxID=3045177 RepID=A0ABT6WUX1_9ACTN|nr:GNAT family N-acetyltransferase [Actinoplanes sandaracinus]MDI6103546.1 GNAT family N-acetyltransferase [Actinoplanes sandaracinus]
MDLRIQRSVVSNLRNRPKALEIGPFVAGLDPDTDSPFINYASPIPGAPITAADVDALVDAFIGAGRKPRLEYVTSCVPELEDLLLAAGFTIEARHQYLICTPQTVAAQPVPEGLILVEPTTDPDRAALTAAANEAFGEAPEASEADIARVRRNQERGGVVLAAFTPTGECAGAGQAMPPSDRLSEVGGIGVRPPFRRRGLAAAITAGVTQGIFDLGVEFAWLEASGDDSWRVYERVGYVPAGHRLYISKG